MNIKTIKNLFYILFILDLAAGAAVGVFMYPAAGIITAVVLLALNITVYISMLKIFKISQKGDSDATR